jgi:transcriptional regulator with XRE-family HTH domain
MDKCVERIAILLSEKGDTNKNLAEHLGIPATVISDWKRGSTSYLKYIAEMSDYFGVSADFLLCRTPIRSGAKWDELIKQYQLCDDDKQLLVDRLLGISRQGVDKSVYCTKVEIEEDMSMVVELISMFEQLSLIGKSRVIAIAADELDKIKTTLK